MIKAFTHCSLDIYITRTSKNTNMTR